MLPEAHEGALELRLEKADQFGTFLPEVHSPRCRAAGLDNGAL
jgi:hypothetical protein